MAHDHQPTKNESVIVDQARVIFDQAGVIADQRLLSQTKLEASVRFQEGSSSHRADKVICVLSPHIAECSYFH